MAFRFSFDSAFSFSITSTILDQISVTPAVAYSLRKLRNAYTGSAIRVRRSLDNAEADIGFSGGNLDTTALLAFCGAGNGFVTTWYDQSVNTRNATQVTAVNQPIIVNAGVVNTEAGRPAQMLAPFATATWLNLSVPLQNTATIIAVAENAVQNAVTSLHKPVFAPSEDIAYITNPQGYALSYQRSNSPGCNAFFPVSGAGTIGGGLANDGLYRVLTARNDNGSVALFVNGVSAGTLVSTPLGSGWTTAYQIGANNNGLSDRFFTGNMGEMVLFTTALSTPDRQTLERNQGSYYGITIT